jgi:hypothetical protein
MNVWRISYLVLSILIFFAGSSGFAQDSHAQQIKVVDTEPDSAASRLGVDPESNKGKIIDYYQAKLITNPSYLQLINSTDPKERAMVLGKLGGIGFAHLSITDLRVIHLLKLTALERTKTPEECLKAMGGGSDGMTALRTMVQILTENELDSYYGLMTKSILVGIEFRNAPPVVYTKEDSDAFFKEVMLPLPTVEQQRFLDGSRCERLKMMLKLVLNYRGPNEENLSSVSYKSAIGSILMPNAGL